MMNDFKVEIDKSSDECDVYICYFCENKFTH